MKDEFNQRRERMMNWAEEDFEMLETMLAGLILQSDVLGKTPEVPDIPKGTENE